MSEVQALLAGGATASGSWQRPGIHACRLARFAFVADHAARDTRGEEPMVDTSSWLLWAIFSAAFAALTAIFAKIGLEGVDSDFATLIRTVVIFCVLCAFVVLARKWSNPFDLPARSWLFLVLSGLATGASWVCYFRALKVGDASKVAPVDKFSVVLVALFAVIALGERPSLREWAGIALVGTGVVVLALK
jgi:bacterial/archaeal transporter family protein